MHEIVREYEYKPKWWVIVFCALFFGCGAVVLGFKSVHNDRGLIINGINALGPTGASIFYGALAVCGFGFVLLTGFLTYVRLAHRQRVAFSPDAVLVPLPRGRGELAIPYADIYELSSMEVNWQRFLYIKHPGGTHGLLASNFPSRASFDEFCTLLAAKIQDSRLPAQSGGSSAAVPPP